MESRESIKDKIINIIACLISFIIPMTLLIVVSINLTPEHWAFDVILIYTMFVGFVLLIKINTRRKERD